jgi:ligand-binding SRPBCC domain-containing protein
MISRDTLTIVPGPAGRGSQLLASQVLPREREQVFDFFSQARQLQSITPPWLHFEVLTPEPLEIRTGTLIDYRLRLHGIPLRWRSRISVWEPPFRFVDEQLRGPYRRWYHEHRFEPVEGGTLCQDVVDYAVLGGRLIDRWLVQPDLLRIFTFRQQTLHALFNATGG